MEPSLSNTNKSELQNQLRVERALQDKYLKEFCSMADELNHLIDGTTPSHIETYDYLDSVDTESGRSLEEEKKLTNFFYKLKSDLQKLFREIVENPKYLNEIRDSTIIRDNIDLLDEVDAFEGSMNMLL